MKKYKGSVYIGVVGGDSIPTQAMISIMNIKRREGDEIPKFRMSTKGYVGRQQHIDAWMNETKHDFILLLDHDMIFETDTLEKLRGHELPYVSGYYMRRRYAPVAPVWFEPFSGEWPFNPWTEVPERGRLHELGASGWGVILMHRDVVTETRKILKGEPEIIEDDMDVWPYDLKAVMSGTETIKPLRAARDVIGSDIRFPFYAKEAGFTLWGDPDVRPSHILDYPLSPDDFDNQAEDQAQWFKAEIKKATDAKRAAMRESLAGVTA